jgi:hypothetical protein
MIVISGVRGWPLASREANAKQTRMMNFIDEVKVSTLPRQDYF